MFPINNLRLLAALTGTEDVVDALNPILEKVVDLVGRAVGDVDGLLGNPVASILTSVSGTLPVSVGDVAQLLAKVVGVSNNGSLSRNDHL